MDTVSDHDPQLGARMAIHGASRSFSFAGWFLAVLFWGVGGFLFWLAVQARSGALHFTGDISVLTRAGGASIGVGVVAAVVFAIVKRRRVVVHAHEHGLRAIAPGRDQIDRYDQLEDVYIAPTGLFGYRSQPGAPWVLVDQRVSHTAALRQRIIDGQIAHRLAPLRDQLARGGSVGFRYFSAATNTHQMMWNPRAVEEPTYELVVTAQAVSLEGKTLPRAQLAPLEVGTWRDKLAFRDADGGVLHAMPATSVLSLDLLRALLAAG